MRKTYEVNGKIYESLIEVSKEYNIPNSTLHGVIKKGNCTIEEAIASIQAKRQNKIKNTTPTTKVNNDSEVKLIEEDFTHEDELVAYNYICLQDTNTRYNDVFNISDDIREIKEILLFNKNIKEINLIDFENLSKDDNLKNYIEKEDVLNIFFYNACIYSNDYYKLISKSNSKYNYQVLTYNIADQLIDHFIIYNLGIMNTIFSDLNFNIVSKDTGFLHFVNTLNSSNIKILGLDNYIESPLDRFRYSICNYVLGNTNINNNMSTSLHQIKGLFTNFMKNKSNSNINDIVKELENMNVVNCTVLSGREFYKFNLDKAAEYINKLKNNN